MIRTAIINPVGEVHRLDAAMQTLCGARGQRLVPVRPAQALVYRLGWCRQCWTSEMAYMTFAGRV